MTPKQKQVYDILLAAQNAGEVTPSYEELRIAIGVKSKCTVHRVIQALVDQGHISKKHNRVRCLEVITNQTDYQKGFRDGVNSMREQRNVNT